MIDEASPGTEEEEEEEEHVQTTQYLPPTLSGSHLNSATFLPQSAQNYFQQQLNTFSDSFVLSFLFTVLDNSLIMIMKLESPPEQKQQLLLKAATLRGRDPGWQAGG